MSQSYFKMLALRRHNLRVLVRRAPSYQAFAQSMGWSSGSYLSQLIGPAATRRIHEGTARTIEERCGLPLGWMDQDHAHE